MKKKKICFIGFSLFTIGGCQRVTISLANDLCEKYETHMLSLCEIPSPNNYFVDERVFVHSFGMPKDVRARHSLTAALRIKKFISDNKIDILFIAGSLPIPVVSLIKPFVNSKIVFCDHENLAGRDKKSIWFRKLACKISDKVVVLTQKTLHDYLYMFKIRKDKIVQIYNYVDSSAMNSSQPYNLNSKEIISVGRISAEKGFDMAVDVAKIVFQKHPDWQWHVYGDGPDYKMINEKIKSCGLENNFILKGADNRVREKYKEYAMCVLPSYREGFAVVLLEAKLSGLPVVSFDCVAGPAEIISDGIDGYLIPCYNKEKMALKICDLIENPERRADFSLHSGDNCDRFSKAKILNRWFEVIDSL
jgi:glycosyltransferase involved in cell wall biosynthesis